LLLTYELLIQIWQILFGTKESYFDSKFKFLKIRISRDHISLQYKRMGLTQASKSFTCEMAFSFSEYSVLRIQNIALEIRQSVEGLQFFV
jgi:hypothetical protein